MTQQERNVRAAECSCNRVGEKLTAIIRVRDQANDQARRPHSEGGAAKIIKIAVQRKESIQGSSDPASLVHLGGEETREHHDEGVEKETKSRQRSNSWPNTPKSPERQHIDKVMCQLCCTGRFQQKNRGSYQAAIHQQSCRQLHEHAEVSADGAENRRRCTSERQNRSSSPKAHRAES